MKKLKLMVLCFIAIAFISSCNKEEMSKDLPQTQKIEPTQEQIDKLAALNIDIKDVSIEEIPMIDGSFEKHLVSGDITISVADLEKYNVQEPVEYQNKQYRAPYIVAPPFRNIRILGYTGSGFALTSKMQTALSWAVNNYNALPNTLNFILTYGTDVAAADIVVYKVNNSIAGGQAGFPSSNGRPYKWLRINSGTDAFSTNVNEHVIGHEIGHAIGLTHPGSGIWIPGTPIAVTEPSIMQPSFSATVDGELTPSDRLALNILY